MRELLKRRLAGSARGQALVETGIVLSLVLFIALATFDLGRGIAAHIALREATQEGALYAGYLLYDSDASVSMADVQDRVRESSSTVEVTSAVVTEVSCDPAPGYLTIRSTYDLPVLTPLAQAVFGSTFELSVELDATNLNEDCS
jgi:TadE-like protein